MGASEAEWSEEGDRELAARFGAQSLRFPGCGPYCAGTVHQLDCEAGRRTARRDDAWQRRSDYEEGIRE